MLDVVDDAQRLLSYQPLAVETADENILEQASKDPVWEKVGALLPMPKNGRAAINIVEFSGSPEEVAQRSQRLVATLEKETVADNNVLGWCVTSDHAECAALWDLRMKGVASWGR